MIKLGIVLFFVLIFTSSFSQQKIGFSYLDSGKNSNIYQQKYYLIKSIGDWNNVKEKNIISSKEIIEAVLKNDYNENILLFYFAGDQCNGVEMNNVICQKNEIVINVNHISLMPECHNAALLVTPWMLISFKAKKNDKIIVDDNVKIIRCDNE